MTLRRVSRLVIWVGLVLVLLEAALRLAPGLVGGRLGNAVYSAYGKRGIYFQDREVRMNFMWPDFAMRAYWNGYWWNHRTDAWGFRDPPDLGPTSLALLGDSLIYGHGVEEEDTVAHFLREEQGRSAYNMGRQGDCLFQEYVLSRLYLPLLRPDTTVLFVFLNDFRDLEIYRTTADIADPPELERYDYAALLARVQHPEAKFRLGEQLYRLRVWRLGVGIVDALRAGSKPGEGPPELLGPIVDDARFEPIARYYRLVLSDLAARSRAQGSELVVVLLEVPDQVIPDATAAQERLRGLLEAIGEEDGFRVLGTREIYRDCTECFLPNDGHLTREGHRRLAEFVAGQIPPGSPLRP